MINRIDTAFMNKMLTIFGNNQIPLFLILSSKFYKCKTFSKKELSLSKNINTKLISLSPFVEDNTTLRIKDEKVIKAWQLNERHYGALTGLNKDEMKKTFGEKKILEFRRSWDISPEPLNRNNLLLTSVTGTFADGDTISGAGGATGTQVSFDSNTN